MARLALLGVVVGLSCSCPFFQFFRKQGIFSLAARSSLFSLASKIAPCIVKRKPSTSWFNARSDGLGGLQDPVRSKALIDKGLVDVVLSLSMEVLG